MLCKRPPHFRFVAPWVIGWLISILSATSGWANDPGGGTNGVGANVTLTVSGGNVILVNGVISATIVTNNGQVTSMLFNGTQVIDTTDARSIYYSMDGGTSYQNPTHCVYSVTTSNADMVDISCKEVWSGYTNVPHALDIDCHYVLRRGDTGLYAYAILSHPAGYPATSMGEWRVVWWLPHNSTDWTFERIYVDALRNWYWGTYTDYLTESNTAIGEVKLLTTGARAGQYDCKYEYNAEYQNIGCWGHASDTNKIGAWVVLGGYDYLNDGPPHTDLTVADFDLASKESAQLSALNEVLTSNLTQTRDLDREMRKEEGLSRLKAAAAEGSVEACYRLAWLFADGEDFLPEMPQIEKSVEKSSWLARARELDSQCARN